MPATGPVWDGEEILCVKVENVKKGRMEEKMDFDVVGHYRGHGG